MLERANPNGSRRGSEQFAEGCVETAGQLGPTACKGLEGWDCLSSRRPGMGQAGEPRCCPFPTPMPWPNSQLRGISSGVSAPFREAISCAFRILWTPRCCRSASPGTSGAAERISGQGAPFHWCCGSSNSFGARRKDRSFFALFSLFDHSSTTHVQPGHMH